MAEPADPVVREPLGGWPRALLRLELMDSAAVPLSREEAFYEVACASRTFRRGVVAMWREQEIIGFPHQSVDEIARSHLRVRRMREAARG